MGTWLALPFLHSCALRSCFLFSARLHPRPNLELLPARLSADTHADTRLDPSRASTVHFHLRLQRFIQAWSGKALARNRHPALRTSFPRPSVGVRRPAATGDEERHHPSASDRAPA
ncbi:hypothetical protein ACQY0O_001759 [Thecaphora frezii]